MPASGSDPAILFVADGHDMGTIATATDISTSEDATAVLRANSASPGTEIQAAIALWRAVDLDVSAVIGHRGTAAVLRRALTMARRTHGWMPEPVDDASLDACVFALSDALASQAPAVSGAANHALEGTFRDLLASLVGSTLTTQLLRAAWTARRPPIEPVP